MHQLTRFQVIKPDARFLCDSWACCLAYCFVRNDILHISVKFCANISDRR